MQLGELLTPPVFDIQLIILVGYCPQCVRVSTKLRGRNIFIRDDNDILKSQVILTKRPCVMPTAVFAYVASSAVLDNCLLIFLGQSQCCSVLEVARHLLLELPIQ
jgi:hypothetical protein